MVMFDFDVVAETKKIFEKFEEFKKNGEIGFCCVNSKTILWITTILQLIKVNGLDAEVKIILRDKRDKKEG